MIALAFNDAIKTGKIEVISNGILLIYAITYEYFFLKYSNYIFINFYSSYRIKLFIVDKKIYFRICKKYVN